MLPSAIETRLTLALKVIGLRDQEAEGIGVTQHLFAMNFTRVVTFLKGGGAHTTGRGVLWAVNTGGLQCLRLVGAFGTLETLMCTIDAGEEGASSTCGKRALFNSRSAWSQCGAVLWACNAGSMDALGAVCAPWARLTRPSLAKL